MYLENNFCFNYPKNFPVNIVVAGMTSPSQKQWIVLQETQKRSYDRNSCQIRLCNKNRAIYNCNSCRKYVCGKCSSTRGTPAFSDTDLDESQLC